MIDYGAPFQAQSYNEYDGDFIKIDENFTEHTESGIYTGQWVNGFINEYDKDGATGALLNFTLADPEKQTFLNTSIQWVNPKNARYSLIAHTLILLAFDPYIQQLQVVPSIKVLDTKNGGVTHVLEIPPGTAFTVVVDFDGKIKQTASKTVYTNFCLGIFDPRGFSPYELRDGASETKRLNKALETLKQRQQERAVKAAAGQGGYQPQQPQYGYQAPQNQQRQAAPQQMPTPQQFTQQWQQPQMPQPGRYAAPQQGQQRYQQPPQGTYGRPQQQPQGQYAPKPSNVPTPEQRQQVQGQAGSFNAQAGQWQPNNVPPPPASMAPQQPAKPQNFKDDNLPF